MTIEVCNQGLFLIGFNFAVQDCSGQYKTGPLSTRFKETFFFSFGWMLNYIVNSVGDPQSPKVTRRELFKEEATKILGLNISIRVTSFNSLLAHS